MTQDWKEETGTEEDNLKVGQLRLSRDLHQSTQFKDQSKEMLAKKHANLHPDSKDLKKSGAI